jgi:hypothetical protein
VTKPEKSHMIGNPEDEETTLSSAIMNPYGKVFRRKTGNLSAIQSLRPKYLLAQVPKNPTEEEKIGVLSKT